MTERQYLDVPEVADLLRRTPKAIYRLCATKKIPGARKVGRRTLFHRTTIIAWVESGAVPTAADLPHVGESSFPPHAATDGATDGTTEGTTGGTLDSSTNPREQLREQPPMELRRELCGEL